MPFMKSCERREGNSVTQDQYSSTIFPLSKGVIVLITAAHSGQLQQPCTPNITSQSAHNPWDSTHSLQTQ